MSDNAQSTGESNTLGIGAAPNNASDDGGLTPAATAEQRSFTLAEVEDMRKKWQDSAYRKARRETMDAAKGEGVAEALTNLGFSSLDEAAQTISAWKDAQAQAEETKLRMQDQEANAKMIRELKEERQSLLREKQEYEKLKAVYESQQKRMLNAELKGLLSKMGAHSDGLDDLVSLVSPAVRWAEDGRLDLSSGDMGTVEEYLEKVKTSKPYFFASSGNSGAGPLPGTGSSNRQPPASQSSWNARLAAYRNRDAS